MMKWNKPLGQIPARGRPASRRGGPMRVPTPAGFTVTECLISIVLLGTVLAVLGPLFAQFDAQRHASTQRAFALEEAQNLLEWSTSQPYAELSSTSVQSAALSDDARELLPDAQLQFAVVDETSPAAGKRIELNLTWRNSAGERVAPLALTAWVYRPVEDRPAEDRP